MKLDTSKILQQLEILGATDAIYLIKILSMRYQNYKAFAKWCISKDFDSRELSSRTRKVLKEN